ncbi:MAG: UDP-N-acetylglucosamine 4,6-dehydratase (inverting), partial [Elusimicrobiota bacterium]
MLNDKVVLITGGTGSFGKAFIGAALKKYAPKK